MSSPQSRGARQRSALATQESKGLTVSENFLLTCSDITLDNFELALLDQEAQLRAEMHELEERLTETRSRAAVVRWFRWFRVQDWEALKLTPENQETAEQWAARMIRDGQRGAEELIPRPSLPPGAAHLAASKRYQQRHIAEGKCRSCAKPLAHNSVEYCEEHLAKTRARDQQEKALSQPGSREYLYAGETPSTHGRQPGTLASLAMHREKRTRAVLAELGIPPESAAVSLKAAIEALLKVMPDSKAKAMSPADLFQAAGVVGNRTTGDKALRELVSAGKIQRVGEPKPGHPCRYFKPNAALDEKAEKDSGRTRVNKNDALMAIMRGEEPKARELVDLSAPKCPRCSAVLIEKGETQKWKRYFECGDCCLGFELVMERHREPTLTNGWFVKRTVTLQPGRTKRDA